MKNIPVYYYKKSAIQYTVLAALALIASTIMILKARSDTLVFGALIFTLIVMFIAASISTKTSMRITLALNGIIVDELDPERFIEELDKAALYKDPKKQQMQMRLFRANAYRMMGRYKDAEAYYIDFLKNMPKTIKDDKVRVQYAAGYASLSLLYSSAGRYETAERAYNKAREQVRGMKLDEISRQPLEFAYYALLANNGEYSDAIAYYRTLSTDSPMYINRVCGHYKLAEAYEMAGYADMAQDEYRFVAENGGKLYIRQLAETKINTKL